MRNLWAPWRISYILGPKPDACIFCLDENRSTDRERFILYRSSSCFVVMNKYPYNNGHVMVAPYVHVSCITELAPEESLDFMHIMQKSAGIVKKHFKAQGMNIGMNIGAAAGAGIKEHLHCHIVPRWNGDANFMAVLAEVHTIPQHIEETYLALLPYFEDKRP